MKLQQLIIHNIASVKDATIDFEAHPLISSEVFLITGDTGSGKSTILDCICLALYNNTPRMENTNMSGDISLGTQSTIKIYDSRQLMRRDTNEAYVKLSFIGNDYNHYQAVWELRKKRTGNLDNVSWSLSNLSKGLDYHKKDEIKAIINQAIGLSFEQFCRTTMLAQGDFTRFLNSKDDEKADILEKITGTDIYSKIGAKIYQIHSAKAKDLEVAQNRLGDLKILTSEEITQKNNEKEDLNKENDELSRKLKDTNDKLNWIETQQKLKKEVESAIENHRIAQERLAAPEIIKAQNIINLWKKTLDARNLWRDIQEIEIKGKEHNEAICQMQEPFSQILKGSELNQEKHSNIIKELQKVSFTLEQELPKKQVYDNTQTIVNHLNNIVRNKTNIKNKESNISNNTQLLNTKLKPAHDKAEEDVRTANDSLKGLKSKKAEKESELNALKMDETNKLLKELVENQHNITLAKDAINTLNERKEELSAKQKSVEDTNEAIKNIQETQKQIESQLTKATEHKEDCQKNYDKLKETVETFAKDIRAKLNIGDICPVCGHTLTQVLPNEEHFKELYDSLNNALIKATDEYEALRKDQGDIVAQLKEKRTSLEQLNKELETLKSKNNTLQQTVNERCAKCEVKFTNSDETLHYFEAKATELTNTINTLNEKVEVGKEIEQKIKDIDKDIEDKYKEIADLSKAEQEAKKSVDDCLNTITNSKNFINSYHDDIETSTKNITNLLGDFSWSIDWQSHPTDFATALSEASQSFTNLTKLKTQLEQDVKESQQFCSNLSAKIKAIIDNMPEWAIISPAATCHFDDSLIPADSLFTELHTAKTQKYECEKTASDKRKQLFKYLQENTDITEDILIDLNQYSQWEITEKEGEVTKLEREVVSTKSVLDKSQENLLKHEEDKPNEEDGSTMEVLRERQQKFNDDITEVAKRIGAIDKELQTDMENKTRQQELLSEIEQKRIIEEKWGRLNGLFGDATGKTFKKIAQSYILSNLIHSANGFMKTLTDRYVLKVMPGTFTILVEDAYQGFLSRSANTISGGESFLVSLALALALSDISPKLTVDPLFIDEGFGTLSGEPLSSAINTLRSLHSNSGRRVGIISHVVDLKEKIPVQIQVVHEPHTSSSTINIVS